MGLKLEPRVIRKYRKLAEPPKPKGEHGIYSFPGTKATVYTFHDGRKVRIHNILQDRMMRSMEAIILAYAWESKEIFDSERAYYTGKNDGDEIYLDGTGG